MRLVLLSVFVMCLRSERWYEGNREGWGVYRVWMGISEVELMEVSILYKKVYGKMSEKV